jgi:hypothetical protein
MIYKSLKLIHLQSHPEFTSKFILTFLLIKDFLGEFTFKPMEMEPGKNIWFTLNAREGNKDDVEVSGEVCLAFQFSSYDAEEESNSGLKPNDRAEEDKRGLIKLIPGLKHSVFRVIYALEPILELRQYFVKLMSWHEKPSSALFLIVSKFSFSKLLFCIFGLSEFYPSSSNFLLDLPLDCLVRSCLVCYSFNTSCIFGRKIL